MAKTTVETIKIESQGLYGPLAEEINNPFTYLSEAAKQIIKFHGMYQQHDRDVRGRDVRDEHYSFMIRTKLPGGQLTAGQYLLHDQLADEYGNSTLRLTTRQTIQFHGVIKHDLKNTIRALNEKLVTTIGACGDIVRNVMACPAPSSDPRRLQVQAFADELTRAFAPTTQAYHQIWLNEQEMVNENPFPVEDPLYGETYLPRKFKIGIAFEGDNCVDVFTQDVGLVALFNDQDELEGFDLLVGGGMGLTHGKEETFARLADVIGFVTPEQVVETVRAVITIHRDYGNRENRKRARLKYVLHDWGVEKFTQTLQERLTFALQPARPLPHFGLDDHMGWHEQGHGRWYLGVHVENGRIADLGNYRLRSGLRAIIEQFNLPVRLTAQQSLLLCDVDFADIEPINQLLQQYGIRTVEQLSGVRRYGMACPAMPTCALAIAEAERVLPEILTQFEAVLTELDLFDEPLSLRMTGCPNGCARPYVAEIAFVGRSLNKYSLFLGGSPAGDRLAQRFLDLVHSDDLIPTLRPLLTHFRDHRYEDEFFGDFVQRVGFDHLHRVLKPETPVFGD